ncbi:MAG TPA: DUF481 domain-containing protein [Bacteroidia bacterium]
MLLLKKLLILLSFFISIISAKAQVVNVESKRFLNDTNGWVGKVDFNFMLTQNTQQIISVGNNVHVQYQQNRHRFLILNDINFIKAGSTDFVNAGFQHFRYNYKIVDRITWEAFTQVQYNKVLKMDLRYLSGTGPRFKLVKNSNLRLYLATLYMYEYEEITNETKPNQAHRLSSYLTFSISLGKHADLTSTTFYQPNFANFNDYRIANDSALELYISKRLNFKTGFNLLYDTRQPAGIPELVYSLRNGLSFKF